MLQPQAFDTEVFGAPVARLIEPAAFLPDKSPDEWRARKLWLIFCRVPIYHADTIGRRLSEGGFRRVETLVTLEHTFGGAIPEAAWPVTNAVSADIADCQRIARAAFTVSRYNLDPDVDQERAAEYKARWAANSIRGRADAGFVERSNGVRGFNFCLNKNGIAVIDLIAVEPQSQGQGIGKAMIDHSLRYYRDKARAMRVGTQAENPRSLAVYASCGFREVSRVVTYHWTNREAAP